MSDESDLLRRYATDGDEAAFAELVRRTLDFVYATARRQCGGNTAVAEDVVQLVFTDLARRAGRLAGHPALAGWLHTATRFAAMKVLRDESRRRRREQESADLETVPADETAAADWSRLQPVIDEALGELRERDRAAIVLRFLQEKSLADVGAALQLSESAARSCVDRALERLRLRLTRHGITSTAAGLSLALAGQATIAAPAGLAGAVSGAALAASTTGGAGLIPIFVMKKILLSLVFVALAAELATATVELRKRSTLETEGRVLATRAPVATPLRASPRAAEQVTAPPRTRAAANDGLAPEEQAELVRLEKRLAQLEARPPGVLDVQMRSPHAAGRDTPQAAMETLTAAVRDGDLPALERFVFFSDDTPENRATFMANFSGAARARYPTPERLMIAFSFGEVLHDPPVAQQVLATHAYSGGVETVTTWTQLASGRERQDTVPFAPTARGWALSPLRLTDPKSIPIDLIKQRLDPLTGEMRLPSAGGGNG